MPKVELNGRFFDARPDRIDIRDREYRPILKSLPAESPDKETIQKYLPNYVQDGMVLNQGNEGACTGFGLAAVINYLLWRQGLGSDRPSIMVSQRMLYHLARFYDEWPGEDYEGSSCRGAMKAWHRHGVCRQDLWPYQDKKFINPHKEWDQDAARRPLGAYYRIDKNSIVDMQAAIFEVGAIYVSANVHDGWFPEKWGMEEGIAIIGPPNNPEKTGGHAFAIVGYNSHGFIVQNSWGEKWGTNGFAILPYTEWVERGMDAWVAVLGAPMLGKSPHYYTPASLTKTVSERAELFGLFEKDKKERPYKYTNREVAPWDIDTAYRHSIVMGNNGIVLNRSVEREDGLKSLEAVTFEKPLSWLKKQNKNKLAFYAHGGLNNEEDSIARIRILGPYFEANGIYPIFFTWKTGFLETLGHIIGDKIHGIEPQGAWQEILEGIENAAKEAKDRAIEAACQNLLVKTVWSQMKQNAKAAADSPNPTLGLAAGHLAKLKGQVPNLEVHLIGHSAGSILLGYMLDLLGENNLKVASCTLFAPACTIAFALEHYLKAIEGKKILKKDTTRLEILDDERERADSIGPYGKSLLYLVSRALEDYHKTPLLGLERAWDKKYNGEEFWHKSKLKQVKDWQEYWKAGKISPNVHTKAQAKVDNGVEFIPLAHGSFDNDKKVMTETLKRILGIPSGQELRYPVENLRGF